VVTTSVVDRDLRSLNAALSGFTSDISNLNASSYKDVISEGNEFVTEYYKVLNNEMKAFRNAIEAYEEYLGIQEKIASLQSEYRQAVQGKDTYLMMKCSDSIEQYKAEIKKKKKEIENQLEKASATVLTATKVKFRKNKDIPEQVEQAMDFILEAKDDDSYVHNRWGTSFYDCSSLIISAWESAGVPVKENGASYTGNMREAFIKTGCFRWIAGDPNLEKLKPGDVLLDEKSNSEFYLGNGKMVGVQRNKDNDEISVVDYDNHWQGILRYTGDKTSVDRK